MLKNGRKKAELTCQFIELFMHIVCNVKGLKTEPEVGRGSAGENKFLVPIYALLLLRFCLSFRLYL